MVYTVGVVVMANRVELSRARDQPTHATRRLLATLAEAVKERVPPPTGAVFGTDKVSCPLLLEKKSVWVPDPLVKEAPALADHAGWLRGPSW
jgi:hypothetical protein